jgi:heme A synthase
MVKSGLVDKKNTNEIDKTPRVSPYRLACHAGFAYSLYAVTLTQSFNLLRRPQEAILNTFEKIGAINTLRNRLRSVTLGLLPFVLLTGFFTAGTSAGASCNTYPWVGDKWFYNSNHFLNSDQVPFWKNFTENKLVC